MNCDVENRENKLAVVSRANFFLKKTKTTKTVVLPAAYITLGTVVANHYLFVRDLCLFAVIVAFTMQRWQTSMPSTRERSKAIKHGATSAVFSFC